MSWLATVDRILNGVMDAYNRKKKRDASNDAANAISDRVRKSDKSFNDVAGESERDSTE